MRYIRLEIAAGIALLTVSALAVVAAANQLLFRPHSPSVGFAPHVPADSESQSDRDTILCDFGRVSPGKTLEKTISIRNDGNSTLTLGEVSTSCSCTLAKVSPTEIPPGAESKLSIAYNPPNVTISDERRVVVAFHGTEPRIYTVEVRAEVRPVVSVVPVRVLIERTNTTSRTAVAKVYNFGSERWEGLNLASMRGMTIPRQSEELTRDLLPEGAIQGFAVEVQVNKDSAAMSESTFDTVVLTPRGESDEYRAELRVEIQRTSSARILPAHLTIDHTTSPVRSVVVLLPGEAQGGQNECTFSSDRGEHEIPATWTPLEREGWKVKLDLTSLMNEKAPPQGDEVVRLNWNGQAIADIRVHVSQD